MLLEQSMWWLAPYACLMVFMVFAMMQFTAALLVKQPTRKQEPVGAAELRQRLLALNDKRSTPYEVVESTESDLELRRGGDPSQGPFSNRYRALLLFDEASHQVRSYETLRTVGSFRGSITSIFSWWFSIRAGYLGLDPEVRQVVTAAGWTFHPVLWRPQATRRGARILAVITPGPLRRWTPRHFWGVVYPLSFFVGLGCLAAVMWPLDAQNWLMLAFMSAIWWGIWGFIAWALTGFPAFWHGTSDSGPME